MTKKEYAEQIAKKLGGRVVEIEKPNTVTMVGVELSSDDDNRIRSVHYVENFFGRLTVDEAADVIAKSKAQHDSENIPSIKNMIGDIAHFSSVKPFLRLRLYNAQNNFEICFSAQKYGLDDLVLVPYVQYSEKMSIKIDRAMLENWDVSEDELFETAVENTKDDFEIQDLCCLLNDMGVVSCDDDLNNSHKLMIVSNREKYFGAVALIFAQEAIRSIFPDGYVAVPSSVHEMLILSKNDTNGELNNIIREINESSVEKTERLSDHFYEF